MNTQNFKVKIKNIRKEALEAGFSVKTMDGYLTIWNSFIIWKQEDDFDYNADDYISFLSERYNFNIYEYNNKNSWHQLLICSKKILDDFETYKKSIKRSTLPTQLYNNYPKEWKKTVLHFEYYCKNVRQNSKKTTEIKTKYAERTISYLYQNGLTSLSNIKKENVVLFVDFMINKTQRVKERYFSVLKQFLEYLFIEDIINTDLTNCVPTVKKVSNKKIPTVLKTNEIKELLDSINKDTKVGKRDYVIILIAARFGLRIGDILNIKLKNIDWENYKLTVEQTKNHNLNILPLTKEIGWAIIDYIKNSRPKCDNEYLFVKQKYPFEKMNNFSKFNNYFDKANIKIDINNKKGIHNLRTTKATQMLEDGIPIDIIASTLGDTVSTVSSIYIKSSEKLLKQCALEVDE